MIDRGGSGGEGGGRRGVQGEEEEGWMEENHADMKI